MIETFLNVQPTEKGKKEKKNLFQPFLFEKDTVTSEISDPRLCLTETSAWQGGERGFSGRKGSDGPVRLRSARETAACSLLPETQRWPRSAETAA